MGRLRRQLESQLGSTRSEASQAQSELRALRMEIEGLVEGDILREVLEELRREGRGGGGGGGAGGGMMMMRQAPSSPSSSPSSAPTAVASSLRALEERSNRLKSDIRQKEEELRMQQQLATSRMTQEATHQADVYEAKASEIKLQLSQYSSLTSSSSSSS